MAQPLKALGDLQRIQKGSDVLKVRSGQETIESIESLTKLLQESAKSLEGNISHSNAQTSKALRQLGYAINQSVNALNSAIESTKTTVIGNMPVIDLSPVLEAVKNIPEVDQAPIVEAVNQVKGLVEDIEIPEVDLTEVLIGLSQMNLSLLDIEMPDLSGVMKEIDDLKAEIAELKKPKEWVFDVERVNSMPQSPIKKVTVRQV